MCGMACLSCAFGWILCYYMPADFEHAKNKKGIPDNEIIQVFPLGIPEITWKSKFLCWGGQRKEYCKGGLEPSKTLLGFFINGKIKISNLRADSSKVPGCAYVRTVLFSCAGRFFLLVAWWSYFEKVKDATEIFGEKISDKILTMKKFLGKKFRTRFWKISDISSHKQPIATNNF